MELLVQPIEQALLVTIMIIAMVAFITELIQYEEIAKFVVIPSLILLIVLTGYNIMKTYKLR